MSLGRNRPRALLPAYPKPGKRSQIQGMNTTNKRRMQLSLFAAAVLAIVAVAAVMMAAGGNPAQATTATLAVDGAGGGNPLPPQQQQDTPPPTPRFPEPDRCSAIPAEVVSSGHIALLDVYWHPREKELTLNPCPPLHTHVPAQTPVPPSPGNPGKPGTPARDERSPSGINIMADPPTIIHVPNSAKVDLSASTTYTEAKYPEVWAADDKENRDTDGDGTGDGVGDRKVWALPACPDGLLTNSLCLGFSADLLNPEDWGNAVEEGAVSGDRKVQFQIDHAHQLDIGEQGGRHVLAYDVPDADASGPYTAVWDTSNADRNKMQVLPGEYEHPIWFFTGAGSYEFQVHVKGHPDRAPRSDGQPPVSPDITVTSDVQEYIFHVGLLADLDVAVTVEPALDPGDTTLDPGDNVNIQIQATNQGPDDAPNTKVQVTLPTGLINVSKVSVIDDYDLSTGAWNVGNLASGANENLLLTAAVAPDTHGQALPVSAKIFATEHINSLDVVELDPDTENNTRTGAITVASHPNVDPMFTITRSIAENSAAGTSVGDPVAVKDPNSGDTLTFGLTGDGAGNFAAAADTNGNAQITVAMGATIDYETRTSYDLVLTVSDGKDGAGNADTSVDHTIGLSINVTDVDESFRATLEASSISLTVGETVTLTPTVYNAPAETLHYAIDETKRGGQSERIAGFGAPQAVSRTKTEAGTYTYYMLFWPAGGTVSDDGVETNRVTVTWSAASQ